MKNQRLEEQVNDTTIHLEENGDKINPENHALFDKLDEFMDRVVTAKQFCDYCGFRRSTLNRLDKKGLSRIEVGKSRKIKYRLGKSLLFIITFNYLTKDESEKFSEHFEKRRNSLINFEL